MKVKILILRGETGLKLPASLCDLPDQTAKDWIKKGWAVEVKEEKAVIETKQEKFTKKHKNTK